MAEGFHFADHASQHVIRQIFEFLPRRRLYFDDITIHEAARA